MTDMHDDMLNDDLLGDEILDDAELAGAERFADALDRIEAGAEAGLDPREDPTLTALMVLTEELHDTEQRATATPRYASYRTRSRDYLLHRLERERAAAAAAAQHEQERARAAQREDGSIWGIPFLRWNVLTPIASAAAAAVAVLAVVVATDTGAVAPVTPDQVAAIEAPAVPAPAPDAQPAAGAQPATPDPAPEARTVAFRPSHGPPAENVTDLITAAATPRTSAAVAPPEATEAIAVPDEVPPAPAPPSVTPPANTLQFVANPQPQRATPRTLPDQLTYIETLLGELTVNVERKAPVPASLLREITESIAVVAYHIESRPDEVTSAQVVAYIHAAADGRVLLAAAVAEETGVTALSAARSVAQAGVDTASWYLKYH